MITDISIDIESLGKRWDAPMLSVGAVAFDRTTGKLGQTFYAEVWIDEAISYGRVDASTLSWWMEQAAEAKCIFAEGRTKQTMYEALRGLGDFVRAAPANVRVWGNGSSFDITILERMYDLAGNGLRDQWKFWNIRDMRTIVEAAQVDPKTHKRVGVHHNALDDAKFQAEVIAQSLMKISKALVGKTVIVTTADEDDEL